MSDTVRLYELPPSPNNLKARIGLGFKGIEYERRLVKLADFPGDRSDLVEASGQPLTPVLQHGERVIFDSGAILRYLEANFRDTPPLFSRDYAEMKEIEKWEWFARTRLSEPIGMVFGAAFAPDQHPDVPAKATAIMRELTEELEGRLSKSSFLVSDRMTAADVTAAPLVALALVPRPSEDSPVHRYFHENLKLGEGRDRTRAWVRKVLEYDPHPVRV